MFEWKIDLGAKELNWKDTIQLVLELYDNVKLNTKVLNELYVRWIDSRGEFCFGEKIVEFNEMDMCLGLGLNLLGDKIYLNELPGFSDGKKYFGSGKHDGNGFIQWKIL
ncbi:hypothetical protein V8G54_031063 [Vigna mungo]|uniref:Uncharacterized protein n=1 Tax=Vigna mungo TaxID=3915 RepID=A0AAQ3MWW8_VIGMU